MKKPQTGRILAHLKRKGTITTMQAIKQYGCTRLASRICELKEAGHKISAYWSKDRSGRVYKYYLA